MASTRTVVKSVRVSNETARIMGKYPRIAANKVFESLYDLIDRGLIAVRDSKIMLPKEWKQHEGMTAVEIKNEVFRGLEDTLEMDEISIEDFLGAVMRAMDKGVIWIEDGEIVVQNAQ